MKTNESIRGLDDAEKSISNFLILLSRGAKEQTIEKFIRNSRIRKKIMSLKTYGYRGIKAAPLLVQLMQHPAAGKYHQIIEAGVSALGFLKPDGLVTEYAFESIAADHQIPATEIYSELEKKHYIENHALTPHFRPMAPDFVFDLDPRFEPVKEKIKAALLSISGDIPACRALLSLLKDPEMSPVYPEIIAALGAFRHPVSYPRLIELSENNHPDAKKTLLSMGVEDIAELKSLLVQGVTEDLWKNNLAEKLHVSLKPLFPLLLESLRSADIPVKERKLICFFFRHIDMPWDAETGVFVHALPELFENDADTCNITQLLVKTGKSAVPAITSFLKDSPAEPCVFRRMLLILSLIDPDKERFGNVLHSLATGNPVYAALAEEAYPSFFAGNRTESDTDTKPDSTCSKEIAAPGSAIMPGDDNTVPDRENESNTTTLSLEEVKKETVNTDPDEYILY